MTKKTLSIAFATLVIGLASTVMVEAGSRRAPGDPLVILTYDLEDTARDVAHRVARGPRRATYRQERALRQLGELQRETRQFRQDVQLRGAWSLRARLEYRELQLAFDRTRHALAALPVNRGQRRQFDRIAVVMRELDRTYELRLARYRRGGIDRIRPAVVTRPGPVGPVGRGRVGLDWDDERPDR